MTVTPLPFLDITRSGFAVENDWATVRLRLSTIQEPQIERPEYQDNSDVYYQPLPEEMPEEQDVHANHDGYHHEHVKHADCPSSHRFVLLCATEWGKSGPSVPGYRRETSSATMSAADCRRVTRATPCPAHIESASMSPVVPTIGGAPS
jgi:hypothetical protein